MHGKEHGHVAGNFGDRPHQVLEYLRIVHVGRTVHRQEDVFALCDAVALRRREAPGSIAVRQQRVDHHVADEMDALVRDPFTPQVVVRRMFSSEQQVGQVIGQHPVDLFGHASVEASEAGFDVGDGDPQLCRHQSAGQRRIDISDDEHEIRAPIEQDRFEGGHDRGRLLRVAAGTHVQRDGRRCNLELIEKHL